MFDNQTISIPCPECGHKTRKSIRWIRAHDEFTCQCGVVIRLERDKLLAGLEKAEGAIANLKRRLRNFGKH
jgi:hypothetical protein